MSIVQKAAVREANDKAAVPHYFGNASSKSSWNPVTQATFDFCLMAVTPKGVFVFVVSDED